ncbi:MAG TPA: hypothetical protein VHX14_01140 [Thermoanaerobaculia bacterium]|nr:hypothetical protein [Thermoanaerobaculia bacterium]
MTKNFNTLLLRLSMTATVLFACHVLYAQQGTWNGTYTQDSVGIGVSPVAQAKLHVFSSSNNSVMSLNGPNGYSYGANFVDTLASEGYCCGVVANLTGNSLIRVSNLQIGYVGYPLVQSNGSAPLYLNRWSPQDVVVSQSVYANGLRVEGVGNSSFAGNLGIGITAPQYALHVFSTGALTRTMFENNNAGGRVIQQVMSTGGATFDLRTHGSAYSETLFGNSMTGAAAMIAQSDSLFVIGNYAATDVVLGTNNAERIRIKSDGRVGIGVPNPGSKLDVGGDVHVSGNIIATGTVTSTFQDLAEWVPSSEHMPPGTVVVVSDSVGNTVAPSLGAYDTRVAGVVSAAPGLLLGMESSSKSKIATTGRVKVRVDATRGPIRLGDLLVTSDKPGVAMKSEPLDLGGVKIHRPGTLIGKALEPLSSGQGEILVLLSLQ